MRAAASLLLIASVVFIASFGLRAFDHGMGHEEPDCALTLVSAVPCTANIASTLGHHISSIKSLFNVPTGIFLALIAFFAVVLLGFAYLLNFLKLQQRYLAEKIRELNLGLNLARGRIISWLSLFELSPSF